MGSDSLFIHPDAIQFSPPRLPRPYFHTHISLLLQRKSHSIFFPSTSSPSDIQFNTFQLHLIFSSSTTIKHSIVFPGLLALTSTHLGIQFSFHLIQAQVAFGLIHSKLHSILSSSTIYYTFHHLPGLLLALTSTHLAIQFSFHLLQVQAAFGLIHSNLHSVLSSFTTMKHSIIFLIVFSPLPPHTWPPSQGSTDSCRSTP